MKEPISFVEVQGFKEQLIMQGLVFVLAPTLPSWLMIVNALEEMGKGGGSCTLMKERPWLEP